MVPAFPLVIRLVGWSIFCTDVLRNMKSFAKACAVLAALHFSGLAFAAGEGWSSDFEASKKQALESKKDLLVDFTGSDWCGWCIKLNEEVFSHAPFKEGVKDKFVLVELDYPQDKSKLSAETIKQNEELAEKYKVQGFPTILLCDAGGRPYAMTGYQPDGPEKYVAHLDELRAKKDARDKALEAAGKETGVAKAKALIAVVEGLGINDAMVANFYGDVVEDIKASDPKDETGFVKKAELAVRIDRVKRDLNTTAGKGDFEGAIKLLDDELKVGGFPKTDTQQIMMTRGILFQQMGKKDEALKALDESKAFDPESEFAANIDAFKKRLLEENAAEEKPSDDAKPAGE